MALLNHVIYISRATEDFSEKQIPSLLEQIRRNNSRQGLSGMLLYIGGSFFQVLEGTETAVESTYARILNDNRHRQITKIIAEPIADRSFDAWTMGYAALDAGEAGKLVGENDFFTTASCVSRIDAGRAKTLLSSLAKKRWELEASGMYRALGR